MSLMNSKYGFQIRNATRTYSLDASTMQQAEILAKHLARVLHEPMIVVERDASANVWQYRVVATFAA